MRRMRKTIRHPETLRGRDQKSYDDSFDYSIDLHGMRAVEAERILLQTISSHRGEKVLVNHGKGEGTLRSIVRRICSGDSRVKRMQKGEDVPCHGGDGVTIVFL